MPSSRASRYFCRDALRIKGRVFMIITSLCVALCSHVFVLSISLFSLAVSGMQHAVPKPLSNLTTSTSSEGKLPCLFTGGSDFAERSNAAIYRPGIIGDGSGIFHARIGDFGWYGWHVSMQSRGKLYIVLYIRVKRRLWGTCLCIMLFGSIIKLISNFTSVLSLPYQSS